MTAVLVGAACFLAGGALGIGAVVWWVRRSFSKTW